MVEDNDILPSHLYADSHVAQCLCRDRHLVMHMSPPLRSGESIATFSAHAFLRDDSYVRRSSTSYVSDMSNDGEGTDKITERPTESTLSHLLNAVGTLASCKSTGDHGAGAAIDMISVALKEDDTLKLLHTW